MTTDSAAEAAPAIPEAEPKTFGAVAADVEAWLEDERVPLKDRLTLVSWFGAVRTGVRLGYRPESTEGV